MEVNIDSNSLHLSYSVSSFFYDALLSIIKIDRAESAFLNFSSL